MAHVVLHMRDLDPFFAAIKSAIEDRGGVVVQSDDYDADHLHVTPDMTVTGPNIINVSPSYVAPYRDLANPALHTDFDIKAVAYQPAKLFFEDLREVYSTGKRFGAADYPEGMLAVCLDGDDFGPNHQELVHRMITDALATGHPVVLTCADPMDSDKLTGLMNHFPGVLVHHDSLADILRKTLAVVSRAGAGVILGHIHRTPAVLYQPVSFDHLSVAVSDYLPFEKALSAVLALEGVYAKYLFWYFSTQALQADAADFPDRICTAFAKVGFDAARLNFDIASPVSDTIVATHEAAAYLTTFLEDQPAVAGIKLRKLLKVSEKSWVFEAVLDGNPVVVKRILDADPARTVKTLTGELDLMSKALGTEAYQVNRCLFGWPDAGVVILSHAPGSRMSDAIAKQSGDKRAKLLGQAGGWLNAYAAVRNRTATFGPKFWVKQIEGRPRHMLSTEGNELFDAARLKLSRLAQITAGGPVTQAASHGDYSGINVHYHKGTVTGLDIQGECWMALAKDAALFLVWQSQYDPRKTGARIYGIDRADYDAFFAGLPMLKAEHRSTIPFFLGWQIMTRYLDSVEQAQTHVQTTRLLRAFVADIDKLLNA